MAHPQFSRRQLLRFAGFVAGAAALPASLRLTALLRAAESPLYPGAGVQLDVHADAPEGCHVRLVASDASRSGLSTTVAAAPGQQVQVTVPYPHDDLVEGAYGVRAELRDANGAVLASVDLGAYRVRRFRFSA